MVLVGVGEEGQPVLLEVGAHVAVAAVGLGHGPSGERVGAVVGVDHVARRRVPTACVDLGGEAGGPGGAVQDAPGEVGVGKSEHGPVLGQRAGADQHLADPTGTNQAVIGVHGLSGPPAVPTRGEFRRPYWVRSSVPRT